MDVWQATSAIRKGFEERLSELEATNTAVLADLSERDDEDLFQLGREAAAAALAPLLWSAAVGETWGTTRTAEWLRVSRQALYKRIQTGSVLALPGRGSNEFPVWQFDPATQLVRHVVAGIVSAFRTADAEVSPLVIAAWANSPNRHLDGLSPAQWAIDGRDDGTVTSAARRAAAGLAA